jgi:hypothetical protein
MKKHCWVCGGNMIKQPKEHKWQHTFELKCDKCGRTEVGMDKNNLF